MLKLFLIIAIVSLLLQYAYKKESEHTLNMEEINGSDNNPFLENHEFWEKYSRIKED